MLLTGQVLAPQLPIGFVADEHVKGTDHDGVSDRDDRPFLPPAGGQALIEGRQVGPLRAGRRMGQLRQPCAQGLVGLAAAAVRKPTVSRIASP